MTTSVISLAEARARGLRFYFTGKPCKRAGHVAQRRVTGKRCIECERIDVVVWRQQNREKHRASVKRYQQNNPEKKKLFAKREYERNKPRYMVAMRRWAAENRERSRQIKADWQKRNPVAIRVKAARRRALIKQAGGSHTVEDIRLLFKRQRGRCAGCTVRLAEYHIDHVVAIVNGGGNGPENLQLLCPICNYSKHVKDPIDWAQQNGRLL